MRLAALMGEFAAWINRRAHENRCPFVLMDGGPCRCPKEADCG